MEVWLAVFVDPPGSRSCSRVIGTLVRSSFRATLVIPIKQRNPQTFAS